MATTHKYGFNFILPLALTDTPMAFSMFDKGVDELGNSLGYYTYNEYMALPNNKPKYTPSETHAIFGFNITSTKVRADMEALLATTPFVVYDGDDIANWEDADQSNYLWIISTEPMVTDYNWDAFVSVSPLFNVVVAP